MQLQFYRDAAGDPRAQCAPPCEPLASFLESDIQGSTAFAHEILRALDRVESGEEEVWEWTGNAHTLTLTGDAASIQSEIEEDAEPCLLSLSQVRQALADWIAFLDE
jgi:uncharacterized protein YacL (UPF0231 family)